MIQPRQSEWLIRLRDTMPITCGEHFDRLNVATVEPWEASRLKGDYIIHKTEIIQKRYC